MHSSLTPIPRRRLQRLRPIVVMAGLLAVLAAPSSAQRGCATTRSKTAARQSWPDSRRASRDRRLVLVHDGLALLIRNHRALAGRSPVRILLDLRSDPDYPAGAAIRQSFIDAGIPIRHKTTTGINHWKMILYAGQAKMHFSAANFANGSYSPSTPYTSYVDEAVYFTDDPAIVESFMTKYDDLWTDTASLRHPRERFDTGAELSDLPD